jgi:hypothetical protein
MHLRSSFAAILLSSCVSVEFTRTATFVRPPKPKEAVEVFRDSPPPRPYQDVGLLRARSGRGAGAALGNLLSEAGAQGCDGIRDLRGSRGELASTVGDTGEKTSEDDVTATCFIYTDVAAPAATQGEAGTPQAPAPRRLPAGTPE